MREETITHLMRCQRAILQGQGDRHTAWILLNNLRLMASSDTDAFTCYSLLLEAMHSQGWLAREPLEWPECNHGGQRPVEDHRP
jgi:hypothetical protein